MAGLAVETPSLAPFVPRVPCFTTTGYLRNALSIPRQIGLDTCAETDVISAKFAQDSGLQRSHYRERDLIGVGESPADIQGVWKVPLRLTDSRG
jgi:hypothetical protein